MTKELLKNLVTQAASLDREIREKTDLLDSLKTELVRIARSHERRFVPTKKGGRIWTAEGDEGSVARVTFPAPRVAFESDNRNAA